MFLLKSFQTIALGLLATLQQKVDLLKDALSELLIVNKDPVLNRCILPHQWPRVFLG